MNIYLLNNKRIEGQPLNSQILKASTRTSEFPEGIIVKVLYITENGFPYIRCWIKEGGAYIYPQTLMLENSWHNDRVHWFNTCCSGAFTLDRWHEMLEALKPIERWVEQALENNRMKLKGKIKLKNVGRTYSQAV